MATASVDKLVSLVQCAICLEKLTDPQAFECFHFFCKKCIPGLRPVNQGGHVGHTCPTCRRFTAKDKLSRIYFMNELLEIADVATDEKRLCNMCETETAELRCIDCKEIYCLVCKKGHDRVPACRNHKWEMLCDNAPLLDKHVFCNKHPNEIAKIHCMDCKTLVCLICNGTEHKQHTAETIEQAVEREKALVVAKIEQVKQLVATNKDDITRAETHIEELYKEYSETEKSIDDKYQEIIMKANKYRDEAKTKLFANKKQQIGEINSWIERKTLTFKSQENIVALSETTLSTAQHSSLLNALQTGVAQGLDSCLSDQQEQYNYVSKITVRFNAAPAIASNFIGTIVAIEQSNMCKTKTNVAAQPVYRTDSSIQEPLDPGALSNGVVTRPLFIPRSLSDIVNCRFNKKAKSSGIGTSVFRFTKINDELWCVPGKTNTVRVFNLDLIHERQIQFPNIRYCRTNIGPIIVLATDNGLYRCQMDGSNVQQITGSEIVDMCWEGNTGYILNNEEANILVVQYDEHSDRFIMSNRIQMNSYKRNPCNTIQTTKDHIYIGQYKEHTILKFAKGCGDAMSSHGSYGSGRDQLKFPRLCGADSDGSLLIADQNNNRFQVLSKNGSWHSLGINDNNDPRCAVIDDDVMYIAHDKYMNKYRIN